MIITKQLHRFIVGGYGEKLLGIDPAGYAHHFPLCTTTVGSGAWSVPSKLFDVSLLFLYNLNINKTVRPFYSPWVKRLPIEAAFSSKS